MPMARSIAAIAVVALAATACGAPASDGLGPRGSAIPSIGPAFAAACATGGRPQSEIDFAGLPPLVPVSPSIVCVLNASSGGSAYDAGYSAVLRLGDGRNLDLYERRGPKPQKPAASQVLREGTRTVSGSTWSWSVLDNGSAVLEASRGGTYVELSLGGDESQIDVLPSIAGDLRPIESFPRPVAQALCGALHVSTSPVTVAAAFDSSAKAIATWQETPTTPGGPHVVVSPWRAHPPTEPVAVCYLDGAFGGGESGATGRACSPTTSCNSTPAPLPTWNRIVYLIGVDRHPIGMTYGSQVQIAIRDPGR